jgi:hypothetical protein
MLEEYNYNDALFGGDPAPMRQIRDTLRLVDGERGIGGVLSSTRYIFSLDLGGRRVRRLHITGSAEMHGHPFIGGITVETDEASAAGGGLPPLPAVAEAPPAVRAVTPDELRAPERATELAALQRLLYATTDDLPDLKSPVIPANYFGPRYDFAGPREALNAASFLYHNGPECAAHIADRGTECGSSTARKALSHYTTGMGIWRRTTPLYDGLDDFLRQYQIKQPGDLPGTGRAWARGVGELLREAIAFGYDKFANSYIDWMDACLFHDANPPHWIRCPGRGTTSQGYTQRQVGNVLETGNRENDGHGICMWGRYMAWHWLGRSREWNARRWKATAAAADWIVWQLETKPLFPGKGKDVLWTESECAYGSYDIYSTYNCLHGLKLSLRLAEQLGKTAELVRWQTAYDRLRQGVLAHLVDESDCGPIWHTEDKNEWQDHAHKLPHIHLATEGDTFTPLEDYARGDATERRYLEISRNSYRYLMKDRNYNCLRMYGYGQGMMLQAALLLDEMGDAEQFLNRLVSYCYLQNLEGWICPEGIIVHRNGRLYVPVNGYMGQDSHVADATKALRVMLGVDDNNPQHPRLVPRFPASWSKAGIRDFPVLSGETRTTVGYEIKRGDAELAMRVCFAEPPASYSVRLGPLPGPWREARVNGQTIPVEIIQSGDAWWAWCRNLRDAESTLRLRRG